MQTLGRVGLAVITLACALWVTPLPGHPAAQAAAPAINSPILAPFKGSIPVGDTWGGPGDYHPRPAIDFRVGDLAPISAAGDGTIHDAVSAPSNCYVDGVDPNDACAGAGQHPLGTHVMILHPDGRYSVYGHLSNVKAGLAKGQAVKAGDFLGYSGNSGYSFGAHLHYAERTSPSHLDDTDPGFMDVCVGGSKATYPAAFGPGVTSWTQADDNGKIVLNDNWDCVLGTPADPDTDGDGVPNSTDKCVHAFGPPVNHGCPLFTDGPADFNRDGHSDLVIFRNGVWAVRSGTGTRGFIVNGLKHGSPGDTPLVGDFNGDGVSDFAVRGGNRFSIRSGAGTRPLISDFAWDQANGIPLVGDFNGDGTSDLAIYRNGVFEARAAISPYTYIARGVTLGESGDRPLVGDVNGDGISDFIVVHGAQWSARSGAGGHAAVTLSHSFGKTGDIKLLGDYSGDGVNEFTIFSSGQWAAIRARSPYSKVFEGLVLGTSGDRPLVGDLDGDGFTDLIAVHGDQWDAKSGASSHAFIMRGLTWGDPSYFQLSGRTRVRPLRPCGSTSPFLDVSATHPFCDAISWMRNSGVSTGYADGTYRPGDVVTRQAMAAFLYRTKVPEVANPVKGCATGIFPDVPKAHPFCAEIQWLDDTGVTGGYSDGSYRPDNDVTRQAMAAFLYRLAGSPSFTLPSVPSFADVPKSHPFFEEIEWMASRRISTGYADDTFRPGDPVTRQAMCAFLERYSHRRADQP